MYSEESHLFGTKKSQKENAQLLCCMVSTCTFVFFMLIYLILGIAFEVACIAISLHYQDLPCYESKSLMPLNQWLLAYSAFKLIVLFIVLVQTLSLLWTTTHGASDKKIMCCGISLCVSTLLIIVTQIILVIIGIIELAAQFDVCKSEANVIRILCIISIVLSLTIGPISFSCTCCSSKK